MYIIVPSPWRRGWIGARIHLVAYRTGQWLKREVPLALEWASFWLQWWMKPHRIGSR